MPIIVSPSGSFIGGPSFTTTVQDVINCVSQDVRSQLGTAGSDADILIDYINRISMGILRYSRWAFLLSGPQEFITQPEVTDYWFGATGGNPPGSVDTGLNISNADQIQQGSVFDRSNLVQLERTDFKPNLTAFIFKDASSRPGKPKQWKNSNDTPYILNIYPGPDNQNTYTPIPDAPIVSTVAGGSLPGRRYYVKNTIVDSAGGESSGSDKEAYIYVPANFLLVVQPPNPGVSQAASGILYNQFNVYASTQSGSETLQNVSPLTTAWTEPTSGLINGIRSVPSTTTVEPLNGYIIEFRYYQQRQILSDVSQVLQIPDIYKDIVCAGVNWLTYKFLRRTMESQEWEQIYKAGLVEMIKDKNLFPGENQFIRPDSSSAWQPLGAFEVFDPSNWPNFT